MSENDETGERGGKGRDASANGGPASAEVPASQAWIVLPSEQAGSPASASAPSNIRVWGLTAQDRLVRGLARAGAGRVEILEASEPAPGPCTGRHVVFRGDTFFDERLIEGMLRGGDAVLLMPEDESRPAEPAAVRVDGSRVGEAVEALRSPPAFADSGVLADLPRSFPTDLVAAYIPALRKRVDPILVPARRDETREIENQIFAASYKGLTDLVTKWIWPVPARAVVRQLAQRGVRPNTITALSYVLVLLATWFFAEGWFATGLAVGWCMTFLDTVDGKLARVTLTSSRVGHFLDHGLDLVHPPIWWLAWAAGLPPSAPGLEVATWIVVGGYLVGRALEGTFMTVFDMEIFVWRPVDGAFRTVVARRNPNLLLLTAGVLFARPDLGFFAVAAWTAVCIAIHMTTVTRAFARRRRGLPVRSWYEAEGEVST